MKVLIIACHPDDEILGVGGTIFSLADKGASIYFLIMTKGMTKVYGAKRVQELRDEAIKVHAFLPSSGTTFLDFPSLNMDTVAKRDINNGIEEKIRLIEPEIIFTHHWNDINSDHKIVSAATMVAARPYSAPSVKKIYCYEVMSTTEWSCNTSNRFAPVVFNDISQHMDKKLEALSMYESQSKEYPHTRSLKSVANHARQRGNIIGVDAAECFQPARIIGV